VTQVDHSADAAPGLLQSAEPLTFDEDDEIYRLTYDPSVDDTSLAIVEIVATITETDAFELKPLYSVIDTNALDGLASGMQDDCQIKFQYTGFQITVVSDGLITCAR
jgi:hypothetical protein